MAKRIRKNTNTKKVVYRGIAVGMAAVMGGVPVSAASGETRKEETVYVNADASGNATDVTVSNWLKNSSGDAAIKDKSDLQDIKNVKGDETYSGSGDSMSWQADGSDIYYQGKTDKELPVSVQFKYFLNGVQMQPSELVGKSGKLKIQADYQNKAKTTTKIDGRTESVYNPFVMVTGMILSDEHFSNIVIDNGKVISDGSRNIVIGVAMPGLKDSLNLSKDQAKNVTLPESLEITADVTDFQMDSTFTVAMSDVLKELDVDGIADTDELTDALDELEDAALKLVDGSSELSDGANTLKDKYTEFNDGVRTLKDGISQLNGGAKTLDSAVGAYTKGAEELNKGIQKYLGSKGVMTGKVSEYKNGVNSVVSGVQTYTKGTSTLADGVISYVAGTGRGSKGTAATDNRSFPDQRSDRSDVRSTGWRRKHAGGSESSIFCTGSRNTAASECAGWHVRSYITDRWPCTERKRSDHTGKSTFKCSGQFDQNTGSTADGRRTDTGSTAYDDQHDTF